jgi:hypothetical protein
MHMGAVCDVLLPPRGSGSVAVEVLAMGFHIATLGRSRARVFHSEPHGRKMRGASQLLLRLGPMVRNYCSPGHIPSERRFAAITRRAGGK